MANCSLPNVEKRFRESNPGLADKLNAIGLKVFEDISSSNLFARKSGNFVFNKEGTKKRVSQNEFVSKLNTDLGAEVVKELENKVSVDVIPLATEEDMAISPLTRQTGEIEAGPLETQTEIKFSKTTGQPQTLTPKEDIESQIIDQMNSMNLVNNGVDLDSPSTTKEKIDVKDLNSRLDTPLKTVKWEDYEGIPFGFTISDQLRSGDVTNPNTGEKITSLKGGIGFNGTKGNENKAWANTTNAAASSMYQKALSIYENNKPLFEKLWEEGRIPQGVIPFSVVKMSETAILSNEAVFRVGIQNLKQLPQKNRKKALSELVKSLQDKIDTETASLKRGKDKNGKPYPQGTIKKKTKAIQQYQKILDTINKNKYTDVLDVLEPKTKFSLPEKAIIVTQIFYGEATPAGAKSKKPGTPQTSVSVALMEGLDESKRSLINLGVITDLLTEPSMKNVPNTHIVSIIGVKVAAKVNGEWQSAGGPVNANHPNYPYGTEGESIGILENPVHMKDAFGEAYGSVLAQIVKNEAKNSSISPKNALAQGLPVSSGLINRTFISAIAKGELDAVDKLAGFLRQAFPNTVFFTSQDAWDTAMADDSIKKKLKDGDVVYAFTTNGNVFINPELKTTKATLHETGHIWMSFIKDNNPDLYRKGLELVSDTKEHQKSIDEYGDTELAREEALMELMSTKGDTIVNKAQKAQFKEWLLSVYKYVSDNFTSLLKLSSKEVEDLTLDKFLEGMLADILSGKEITTKPIKGDTRFSISRITDQVGSVGIEQLRAQEQAEYDAMSDPTDEVERQRIYDKYDQLITPLLEQQKAAQVSVAIGEEEFKSSEELPNSFATLSDFEEPAYTPTTPETHPEREEPLAPEPVKSISQQWSEYESLKDRTDLTPDEELDLAAYRAKFDMFDTPSQYEKVMEDPTSKAFVAFREKNLEKLLLRFADKFGITIANIEDFQKQYFEKTGKFIPANGVANLFEKVIYVSEGNTDALTEEVAHFIIAMLPKDGEIYQNLKQYISRTKEYELFYEKYLAQYDGDVDKTEEEIMGKVLKNSLQDKEETVPLSVKSSVTRIINYIKSLFSDDKMEYLNSLNQLKKMFFSENLAEGLDAANINYDQLYQLNFEITGKNNSTAAVAERSKKFDLGANLLIENLEDTLSNIRQQAIESNQTKALESSNYLLSILGKKTEQDADKAKILSNVVFASVSTIRRITGAFQQFKKLDIPTTLKTEFNRDNLIKLSYDDYNKSLSKLASYINYLQSLYALSKSIESTAKLMSLDSKDLYDFKKILKTLDDSITDNDEIMKAFDLLNADGVKAMLTNIEGIYIKNVKEILDIYMSALSTEDQKRFLDYQNESYFANTDAETIADKKANIEEYSKGMLNNIRNFFGKGITPVTMQNDTFIQSVDRFVWAMEQMGKERASKEVAEVQKIENRLYQNGANAQNQDWLSEKDDKGRSTGNLITKLNFSKYSNLAAKNLKDKLRKLPFASNDNIKALQKIDFNSPKQVFDSLGELLKDNKITQEEFDYAKNYLMAEKALYDLEHTTPNYSSTTLSSNSLDALKNFIDRNITNIREALNDPNFDWTNDEIDLISNDLGDLQSALEELIEEKRTLLEEKYFTVDENKRVLLNANGTPALDKDGNPRLNPVFKTELDFVEGLLNKYKYKIGYATDPEGNFYPDKINIDVWGDEFLFELSASHPDAKEYTNKDYLELEDKAAKGDALAVAKMDMVNYIKKWNRQNNLPSNFLPKGAKKDSEYLQMFGNKRFINIFGVNFDVAKIITQVVIPFAGVANTPMLFGMAAGLVNPLTLGISSAIFSYFFWNRISNQAVKFLSIYKSTYGDINDSKGLKKMAVALAKSLGVYSKALQFELNKDDNIISTGKENTLPSNKVELWLKNMFYKIFRAVDEKQANKKNKIDVIPQKYTEYIEPALRSNQYLDNFKSFIYATKEYENKSMYEGAIRAMNDLYRKRESNKGNNIGDNYLESIYIDRYWYNKIYPNSFAMKFMRVLAAQTGFNQLTGNLNTGIKNILTGISMISANGGLLATMPAIKDATWYSLNMLFLSKGKSSRVALEQNKIQMIKKHLRSSTFGGIVDFDYSDSSLVQKLRLNNAQIVSDLGESFISSVIVYKFLRDTKLIDENGKKIDIIKHLVIKDGRLSLDDKVAKKIYFNNINEIQTADDLQLDPGYVKDINLRAIVPKNLQKDALVPLEIDLYLNRTLLQNIDYFRQRSQGVYNIMLKPRVSTTAIGTALFMYQHYVLPGVYTAFGRKKNNPNLEGSEEGFVITLAKALGRGVSNRFKAKLSPDSVENILKINNVKTKGLLEDLGVLSMAFKALTKNKNIVTQTLLDVAAEQEKAIKFEEEQDAIVAQGGVVRKVGPAYYSGFKGKNKEEIFKQLLIEANKQMRLNEYEANNYKKVASILTLFLLLKAALKFAYPPLEEEEVATYMASVAEVVSSEIFRTWFPFLEGSRLGFTWNLNPMGRNANESMLGFDFRKTSPIAGTVDDLAKSLYWSGSVGLYNLTGIVPFSEETGNKLIDVTGGEIPLMKTRYFYNRKGYVIGEVNVGEEVLKDFLIGNRLRDAMQSSELRQEKYLDMPTGELANMIYKLQNGYYKAYGRNLEEEIKPTEEE